MPLESDSEMVAAVFKSAGIIIGAPTYEYKLFPPVAAALNELGRKRITGIRFIPGTAIPFRINLLSIDLNGFKRYTFN
jgi:hypothetical protein